MGSSDPSHFIFEINVGKSRINDAEIEWRISRSTQKIRIQSRSMSDPPFLDIDFKNKMAWVWTTLKISRVELTFRILDVLFQLHYQPQWFDN